MSSDLYSKKSLMGNWYEERLAPQQPSKVNKEQKTIRDHEEAISYTTPNGQLLSLPTVKRQQQWISYANCDDGFKEHKTINQTTFDKDNINNFLTCQNNKQIVKDSDINHVYPEVNKNSIQTQEFKQGGFYDVLLKRFDEKEYPLKQTINNFQDKFDKEYKKEKFFYKDTTYGKAFCTTKKDVNDEFEYQKKLAESCAGINERPFSEMGLQKNSCLVAEKYLKDVDPKSSTNVQRSWLPIKDNVITVVENNLQKNDEINKSKNFSPTNKMQTYKNNLKQELSHDIATSVALGDGAYQLKKKNPGIGEFRKIRTDVTLIKNEVITRK